jgi:hypothetical protein
MYLLVTILFIIFVLAVSGWLFISSFSMLQDIKGGAFFVPTPHHVGEKLLRYLHLQPGKTLIDLGSGDARILRHAAKQYQTQSIGYEIAWWPRLEAWFKNQIAFWQAPTLRTLIHTNAIPAVNAKVHTADYIFLYASPQFNQAVEQKLRTELPPHGKIVTLTFPLSDWAPTAWGTIHDMNYWIYTPQIASTAL